MNDWMNERLVRACSQVWTQNGVETQCSFKCTDKDGMTVHIARVHGIGGHPCTLMNKIYKEQCTEVFATMSHLARHQKSRAHAERLLEYPCKTTSGGCGKHYASMGNLRKHQKKCTELESGDEGEAALPTLVDNPENAVEASEAEGDGESENGDLDAIATGMINASIIESENDGSGDAVDSLELLNN